MSGTLERSESGNQIKKCSTVKIQLPETENTLAHTYVDSLKIQDFKNDIAKKFKVEANLFEIYQVTGKKESGEQIIELCVEDQILRELVKNDFGIIDIQLKLTEEATAKNIKLDTNVYYSNFTLPDIITVHGESGDLVVEIENKSIVKPYLGGFRNKKTQVEYYHAFTQTGPINERIKYAGIFSRETQTITLMNSECSAFHDRSTQSLMGSLQFLNYFDDDTESLELDEETLAQHDKLRKVLLIQRNFRRYRLQQCIKICAEKYRKLCTIKEKREARIRDEYITAQKKPTDFPITKKDFDLLLSQIAGWKEAETKRINEEFTGPTEIAELKQLLEKEVQLLNGVEKRRLDIRKEQEHLKQDRKLEKLGESVKWIGYKNKLVEMDSLRTQRARFLTGYFKKLRSTVRLERRFELFQEILDVLSKEDSLLIFELDTLFEREKKLLLLCNLNNDNLQVLRERQLMLFMDIIKDEVHNKLEKDETKVCDKCKLVLPASKFISTRDSSGSICKSCLALKKSKTDLSVYRAILRGIQREERRRGALSSLAFIIQESDVKKIIETIWHGHSILSQCSNTLDLRLPRWITSEDWAPWNCVCLTETESQIHLSCTNLEQIYGEKIIKDCHSKHSLARKLFTQFKDLDHTFVESGKWWNAGFSDS